MNCEQFERDYDKLSRDGANQSLKAALLEHQRDCSHCQSFSAQTERLRVELCALPRLEASPHLLYSVRREVARLERGDSKPIWDRPLLPRFAVQGVGFALALVLGVFLLRSQMQPQGFSSAPPAAQLQASPSLNVAQQGEVLLPEIKEQEQIANAQSNTHERIAWFDESAAQEDTEIHPWPEQPGLDSIPIPVEDDLWRANQVSTAPQQP